MFLLLCPIGLSKIKKNLQKQKGANYDISIDRSFVSCDAIYFTICIYLSFKYRMDYDTSFY